MNNQEFQYDQAGVDTARAQEGLSSLARSIAKTHSLRDDDAFGRPATGFGYYANVLQLPDKRGLAIATDGVGTKIIVAELAGRYDTIGIDLIAMNVNDIICVGAEPFAMVDYVAVGQIDSAMFEELGRGLLEGSRESGITIPGGEIAQVSELIRGHGDCAGLDLVGTAVGLVDWDDVNLGQNVEPGDVVIGLQSNGLHSNGYTLARRILLDQGGHTLDDHISDLGHTIADELLRPTRLYVKPIVELLKKRVPLHALLHITGDGFCNMNRVKSEVGFVLEDLPDHDGIYHMLQSIGSISIQEMFTVFNMGIGFCVVAPPSHADEILETCQRLGTPGSIVGYATSDHPNQVRITQHGLVGGKDRLVPEGSTA